MNRLLPTAIASLALLLMGAGTASASAPLKIVADAGANVFVTDHEFFSADEHFRRSFAGSTLGTLSSTGGKFTWKMPACAGDEVRAELIIDGYRFANETTATITAHLDLYEGTSCSTKDFEGQSGFVTFTLKAGESKHLSLYAHGYEIGYDHAEVEATIRAVSA